MTEAHSTPSRELAQLEEKISKTTDPIEVAEQLTRIVELSDALMTTLQSSHDRSRYYTKARNARRRLAETAQQQNGRGGSIYQGAIVWGMSLMSDRPTVARQLFLEAHELRPRAEMPMELLKLVSR
jgi:hypothetical protein